MRELGGVTSTWANVPRAARRCAQAISMPLAWAFTLGICAASAFAVRDTVFPTLGQTSSQSVWDASPAATAPRFSASDAFDVTTPTDEAGLPVRPTVLVVDLGEGAASSSTVVDPLEPETRVQSGPPFVGEPIGSSAGSSKGTVGGATAPSTATTVHTAPSTSSPGPSTSAVTVTTSASSPSTTDPATTDSIGGSHSGRGSGSGGGGGTDDTVP